MVDRIANPWGERTPYGRGCRWPARVDMQLAEGVAEGDVERWSKSASVLHSNGDALDIAVCGGRIVGVRGREGDRVNRGRLGPKDLFGWQANNSPDRLTRPLVREGGQLVESDWDTAMGRLVDRSKRCCRVRVDGDALASTPLASCFWRSTTRWRYSGRRASERRTWMATLGFAPRRRQLL